MRVLHIDDSPDNRELLKQALERIDPEMEVFSASAPSESIRMMEELQIDCIISDHNMPEMDGIELCRIIRDTSDIPFIIYTGKGSEEVASVAFEAGADDYIRKEPGQGHYRVLANRIRQAVEGHWRDGLYRDVLENTRDSIIIVQGTRIVYANQATADLVGVSSVGEFLETDALDWILAKDRERIQSIALGRQRGELQPSQFEIEYQQPDGERQVLEVSSSLIPYKGRPASLSVVRDISGKAKTRERLAALHGCTVKLASADSVEEVARKVFESIEEVFDFRWGNFAMVEDGRIISVYNKGLTFDGFEIVDLDGPGVVARTARTGESQLVPETRLVKDHISTFIEDNLQSLSELAVPIKEDGNVIGVLNLESPSLNGFSVDDQKLLEICSQYIASAIVRIRNEGLLKASEEKYRNILESSLDGIIVTKDTKIVFGNQRFAEMLGYEDPSELLGRSSWDLVAPEYLALIQENSKKRREGDRSTFRYELDFVGNDGTPFSVESQTSPIEFEGENAVLGVHRDNNERKRLDAELRASKEQWEELFESAPDGIVAVDLKGVITSVNEAFEISTGYPRDQLVGKHFTKVGATRAKDVPHYLRMFKDMLASRNPTPFEVVFQRKDGTERLCEAHASIIKKEEKAVGFQVILRDITERDHLKTDLVVSEARWRSLVELAPDGIITFNPQGVVTSINEVFEDLTGFSKDEVIGKHLMSAEFLGLKDVHNNAEELFLKIPSGQSLPPFDFEYRHKDGSMRWGQAHVRMIRTGDTSSETLMILREVSERKRLEEELRESEERNRTLVALSPQGIMTIDREGYVRSANPAVENLHGFPPRELLGKHFSELPHINKGDIPRYKEGFETIMLGNVQPYYEYTLTHKDGTKKWATVNVSVMKNPQGEIDGFLAVLNDVTDRKQMEDELRRSEERYRSLIELAPDGVMTLNLKGEVTSVNTAYMTLTGYSENEIIGKHFTKLGTAVSLKDMPNYVKMFTAMLRGETPPIVEFNFKRKDGTLGRGETRSQIVEVEPGTREVLTVHRDITERMRLEEQLREYTRNLEGLVKERTQELVDAERLVAAGKVSAMVGHDLRGPLVVVRNAVNLARKDPEKTDRMLDMIDRNAGQAIDILEELRTITRDDPVSLATLDINHLVNSIIEDTILPPGVELRLEIDEDLPKVILDEAKTMRAMQNLIENAKDAMPHGGDITIRARHEGDHVVFSVSDTGMGIADEDHENIFKPFYTTKPKGLGLGLPSTRRMIEVQGGTISIESNEGKGSTFSIHLPLEGQSK
jgi:PAS domain S-box-containing protein